MRKKISLVLTFIILLATTAIAHAADKCASLEAAANAAKARDTEAVDQLGNAVEALRLAREHATAAENAFAEVTKALAKATADWKAAIKLQYACLRLAKKNRSKCKAETQAVYDAFEAMKQMEENQDRMAIEIGSSQLEIDQARAKVRAALDARKKARKEYMDALDAFGKCLEGPSPKMS